MYDANRRQGGMVNRCVEMTNRRILISDGLALTLGISNKCRNGGRRQHIHTYIHTYIHIYIYIYKRNCVGDEVMLQSEYLTTKIVPGVPSTFMTLNYPVNQNTTP